MDSTKQHHVMGSKQPQHPPNPPDHIILKNVTYLSIQLQYLILGLETHVFKKKKLDQKHKLDDLLATLSPAHFTLYFSVGPHPSLILTLSFS